MKMYCGCGLWLEVNQYGILTSTFVGDQENSELLKNSLCISLQNKDVTQYFRLSEFLREGSMITGSVSVYLAAKTDIQKPIAMVGEITLNSNETYHYNSIQEIGIPELRSAVYGILPKQVAPLPVPLDIDLHPKTDLHTHFSGAITADILIEALFKRVELNESAGESKRCIPYLSQYLKKVGINIETLPVAHDKHGQIKEGYVDISPLVTRDDCLKKFRKLLHIPANKRIIFDQMEEYYCYRGVFIQDVELLEFFLLKLADNYQKQGIQYVEISFAKVAKINYLRVIHETLPIIEERTGVKIRFLAMLARTASKEMRDLQIQKYEQISLSSPYVVGIDLLSAEINSSYVFYPELKYLASRHPGKVIRVHAGETSYHLENVRAIASLAKQYPNVLFRIGHGTFGASKEALADLQSCNNIIIEINMASNIALNMHNCQEDHPIDDYMQANIPIVLGSDGHGLYQTTGVDLIKLLTYRYSHAVLIKFVQDLHLRETKHIKFIDWLFVYDLLPKLYLLRASLSSEPQFAEECNEILGLLSLLDFHKAEYLDKNFVVRIIVQAIYTKITQSESLQHYFIENIILGPEVRSSYVRIAEEKKAIDKKAKVSFQDTSRNLDAEILKAFKFSPGHDAVNSDASVTVKNAKTPIMLTGLIPTSIDADYPTADNIRAVIATFNTLLEILNNEEVYFVTTGMDIGVQKIVHRLINDYNKSHPHHQGFELVAYVQSNITVERLSSSLTNIVIIDDISSIYKIYKYFMKLAIESGLRSIHFGDSMWNRDVMHAISEVLKDSVDIDEETKQRQITRVHDREHNKVKVVDLITNSLDDLITGDYLPVYAAHLQKAKSLPEEFVLSVYGSFHPSSITEMVSIVIASLDSKTFREITFTEEQKDHAIIALTRCFEVLCSGNIHRSEYKELVTRHIQSAFLLTQQIKELLIVSTLKIWQEATAGNMNTGSKFELTKVHEVPHEHHRRSSFFNSKDPNIYNIPLGDKVAFRLSRKGASQENLLAIEIMAMQAILDEQQRKRELKRTSELKYATLLILDGKNTADGKEKAYINDCKKLLSYLNALYIRSSSYEDLKSMLIHSFSVTGVKDPHLTDFIMQLLDIYDEIGLNDSGYFNVETIKLILDIFVQYSTGEYTFEVIRKFLNKLEEVQHTAGFGHTEYFDQHLSNYIATQLCSENAYSIKSSYIASRLFKHGICFDKIHETLIAQGFIYKSLSSGEQGTLGFYFNGQRVLDVFWGDERFYPSRIINGVQVYKKHRVPNDEPWRSRDDLLESDFEYILEKRGNFVKRFTYRFIRPTERMHLAQVSTDEITPQEASSSFRLIEGNQESKKYFVPHADKTSDELLQDALAEELGELSLNRMGTYRFVTSGQSGFKYDVRANNETLFLRHACRFDAIELSESRAWQGGGVIKIDLTKIERGDIRCQYKTKSRVNMDLSKVVIAGVYNKKTIAKTETPTKEKLSAELDSQLNKARKSAIRNRETHLAKVPLDAIVGWKPYPQYPVWMEKDEITMPILLIGSTYLTSYPVLDCSGYLMLDYTIGSTSMILLENALSNYPIKYGYGYFINCLKVMLESLEDRINKELLNKILLSVAINTNYIQKYIDKKSIDLIDNLLKIMFENLIVDIENYSVSIDLRELSLAIYAQIDKSITSWEVRREQSKVYSSTVSMAFYMSPEKTVHRAMGLDEGGIKGVKF